MVEVPVYVAGRVEWKGGGMISSFKFLLFDFQGNGSLGSKCMDERLCVRGW